LKSIGALVEGNIDRTPLDYLDVRVQTCKNYSKLRVSFMHMFTMFPEIQCDFASLLRRSFPKIPVKPWRKGRTTNGQTVSVRRSFTPRFNEEVRSPLSLN
jgi:hypothetical protein